MGDVEGRLSAVEEALADIKARLTALENQDPDRLLTTKEACRFLGVGARFLYRRIEQGEIKAVRDGRRFTRFMKSDLVDYAHRHRG